MTKTEVIAIAKEAGMEVHERKGQIRIGSAVLTGCDSTEQVERFAALVAEAEREACAQIAADTFYGNAGELNHVIAEAIRARSTP